MSQVSTALLPPKVSLTLGGKPVLIERLSTESTLRLLPALMGVVAFVQASPEAVTLGDVLNACHEEASEIICECTGLEPEKLRKLRSAELASTVEALLEVNRGFFDRPALVKKASAEEPKPEASAAEPFTLERSLEFIERLVYDLRAAGMPKAEVMANTLADNLALFDAVTRREAREQLARIDALRSTIAAAFSKEASSALTAEVRRLALQAGFDPSSSYTEDKSVIRL